MLVITIEVDAPAGIGAKEQVAMALESLGNVRVANITEEKPEQMRIQ